jgi:hypothetical protein
MTEVLSRPEKSTIVRSYLSPPPIRAAFWFLERTAPGIGARWAERIWFRLPRRAGAAGLSRLVGQPRVSA